MPHLMAVVLAIMILGEDLLTVRRGWTREKLFRFCHVPLALGGWVLKRQRGKLTQNLKDCLEVASASRDFLSLAKKLRL